MTIDVGLTAGICSLWQQEALFDYTIQVEDHEIPVHKAIMASVSEYFRVMLNGSLLETKTNRVELKGQRVEAVSKLIELIYTGDDKIVNNSAMEIFGSAVYFQMTFVIQACVDSLLDNLNEKNCLDVLSLFVKYSVDEEVEKVKKFLNSNCKSAVEYCKYEDTPYEVVKIVTECWGKGEWGKSEWDLFLFLKFWVNVNYEERKVHVNDLMSRVRFSLMDQGQLAAIMEMDIFTSSDDPWCRLVHKAVTYHKNTISQKVLDTSLQSMTRGPAVPMVFTTVKTKTGSFHALEKGENWSELKGLKAPTISRVDCVIDVNNFLIVCSAHGTEQLWHIFNPRTMKWSQMVNKAPKTGFALVYHGQKLYALGGHTGLNHTLDFASVTRSVEEYSFHTNTWQEVNRMPSAVTRHGACVLEDSMYVSGGWRGQMYGQSERSTRDVDCLDIRTGTWKKKAPMLFERVDHKLHVMTLHKAKVIVLIYHADEYDCDIMYYQPVTDQWSTYNPHFSSRVPYDIKWIEGRSVMLVKGNTVFLVNIDQGDEDEDAGSGWNEEERRHINPDNIEREEACVQWKFSQTRNNISEVEYPKCPSFKEYEWDRFGAMLSM